MKKKKRKKFKVPLTDNDQLSFICIILTHLYSKGTDHICKSLNRTKTKIK